MHKSKRFQLLSLEVSCSPAVSGLKEDVLIEKKQKIHSFLDRRHSHPSIHPSIHPFIHSHGTRSEGQSARSFSPHFVCHCGSQQGTLMYTHENTHTQTRRRPKPMSDRAGEPGPLPTSGKNPRHPPKKSKCASFSSTAISLFSTDFTPKTRVSRPSFVFFLLG